jgi:hypothetical protein
MARDKWLDMHPEVEDNIANSDDTPQEYEVTIKRAKIPLGPIVTTMVILALFNWLTSK